MERIRVRLDWSRMLGFDQARRSPAGIDVARLTKVGSKPQIRALHMLGSKISIKPGIKPVSGRTLGS